MKTKPDLITVLAEALDEITTCDTCEGKGKWTPECFPCLCGEGPCRCETMDEEDCPQCCGTGRDYCGCEKAKVAIDHLTFIRKINTNKNHEHSATDQGSATTR